MRVVLLEGDRVLRDQTFDTGPLSLGSSAVSQVHLPDLRIPLEHVRLVEAPGGQWHIEARSSDCSTQVNGRPLDTRCPIYNGDEVCVDRFRIKLAVDGDVDLGVSGPSSLEELQRIKEYPLPLGGEVRQFDAPLEISPDFQRELAEFALDLQQCTDVESLADRTLAALFKHFRPSFAWFGCRYQPAGELEMVDGRTEEGPTIREPQALESLQFRCLERQQALLLARKRSKKQESGLAVPLEAHRGRFGLLYVEADPSEHRYKMRHLDSMVALASHVGLRLEEILLGVRQQKTAAAADSKGWLRGIQARMNPRSAPRWSGYELAIYNKPGSERGGDVYDAMTLPNKMGSLLVANVHAGTATTVIGMAETLAAFRIAGLHGDAPRVLMKELAWLVSNYRQNCQISAAHVVFNPKTGAMELGTAGPVGISVISRKGEARNLTDPNGARLGSQGQSEFPRKTDRLEAGDLLAVFSPGWANLSPAKGGPAYDAAGDPALLDFLRDGIDESPGTLVDDLQHEVARRLKNGSQPVDITLMLLRRG